MAMEAKDGGAAALEMVTFTIIIDDIVFPDGRTAMACLGGGGDSHTRHSLPFLSQFASFSSTSPLFVHFRFFDCGILAVPRDSHCSKRFSLLFWYYFFVFLSGLQDFLSSSYCWCEI